MTYEEILQELPAQAVLQVDLSFPRVASGKVREIFDLGEALLLVATDRLSAFDVIMNEGVPGKGILLTQISLLWFHASQEIIQNHLLPGQESLLAETYGLSRDLQLRSMAVRKLKPLPIECVVRGYLAGSGWSSYRKDRTVCGIALPPGLRQAARLPEPIFTPTTKAAQGAHDEPIDDVRGEQLIGVELYRQVREVSLALYSLGHQKAEEAGIILADTKFEFGLDAEGKLHLIDEVLTPDSSRYWPRESYEPGGSPPSFDKQYVRDYLLTLDWEHQPPPPALPSQVLWGTREKYLQAYRDLSAQLQ